MSLAVLIMAEQWHTPPWEIAGGSPLTWFWRWNFLNEQRAKNRELEKAKNNG